MSTHKRTMTPDSGNENARKRVCKACDRCRMKKSKCDGADKCSRCQSDNALCEYTERQRPQEAKHPRGYVEAMERHQQFAFAGLKKAYELLSAKGLFPGGELSPNENGVIPVHDILERLDALPGKMHFEENHEKIKRECIDVETSTMKRSHSSTSGTTSNFSATTPQQIYSESSPFDEPSLSTPLSAMPLTPEDDYSYQQFDMTPNTFQPIDYSAYGNLATENAKWLDQQEFFSNNFASTYFTPPYEPLFTKTGPPNYT